MENNTFLKPIHAAGEAILGFLFVWGAIFLPGGTASAATASPSMPMSQVFDGAGGILDILYASPDPAYFYISPYSGLFKMKKQFDGDYRFKVGPSDRGSWGRTVGIQTEITTYYFSDTSQFLASGKKGCPTLIAGGSAIIATAETVLPCDRIDGLSETKYVLPPGAKAILRRDAFNYRKGDSWEECLFVISPGSTVILPDGRSEKIYPGEHYCENSAGNRWVKVREIWPESLDGTSPATADIFEKLGLGYPLNFAQTLRTFDPESGRERIESVFDALEKEYGAGERDTRSLVTGDSVGISYTTPGKGRFYWVFEGPLYRKLSFDPLCPSDHAIEISELGEYRFCVGNHYGTLLPEKLGYEAARTSLESYLTDLDKDANVDEWNYGEKKGIYVQFRGLTYRFFMSPRGSLTPPADVPGDSPLGISRVNETGAFSVVYATEWKMPWGISEARYRYFLVPYVPLTQIHRILQAQGSADFNVYWRDDALVAFLYQGIAYKTIPLLPGEECSLKGKEGFYPDSRGLVFEVEGFGCQRFILSGSGL